MCVYTYTVYMYLDTQVSSVNFNNDHDNNELFVNAFVYSLMNKVSILVASVTLCFRQNCTLLYITWQKYQGLQYVQMGSSVTINKNHYKHFQKIFPKAVINIILYHFCFFIFIYYQHLLRCIRFIIHNPAFTLASDNLRISLVYLFMVQLLLQQDFTLALLSNAGYLY